MPTVSPVASVGAPLPVDSVTSRVSSRNVVTVQAAPPIADAPSSQVLPPPSGSTASMFAAVTAKASVAASKSKCTRSPAWIPAPPPLASSANAPSSTGDGAASTPSFAPNAHSSPLSSTSAVTIRTMAVRRDATTFPIGRHRCNIGTPGPMPPRAQRSAVVHGSRSPPGSQLRRSPWAR